MTGAQIRPSSQIMDGSCFATRSLPVIVPLRISQLYITSQKLPLQTNLPTFIQSHCISILTSGRQIIKQSSHSHHGRNRHVLCFVPNLSIQTGCFFTPGISTNVSIFGMEERFQRHVSRRARGGQHKLPHSNDPYLQSKVW